MRYALHAEWTKLRTLPSNAWLAVAVAAFTVLAGVAATATADASRCPSPAECFEDIPKLSLTGVWLGQVAVVALAVGMIAGEYGTGLIRATLAARPRRHEVLLTKAAVLTATVACAGALGVLGSLVAGRFLLPGNGFTEASELSILDPSTLRATLGSVLYLVLVGLLAFGVAAAVRGTAAALVTMLALLLVVPALTELVADETWREWLHRLAPMTAGLAIQATQRLEDLPIAPWPGMGVLAAWAAAALLLGGALLTRRDQ